MATTLRFEKDCRRCSGTGIHGGWINNRPVGACWGCGGNGGRLTADGRRALAAYRTLIEQADLVEAHTLDLGQRFHADGQFREVVAYTRKGGKVYVVTHKKHYEFDLRQLVPLKPSQEQLDAIREQMRGVRGAIVCDDD